MTKAEIAEDISKKINISKKDAILILNATMDTIVNSLVKGEKVFLAGFGTFMVVERKGRKGYNPKTGEIIQIASAKKPKFSAGKNLRNAVRNEAEDSILVS